MRRRRVAEDEPLRRRRRVDDVGRIAEVLLDQLALGQAQRLDHVAGEEAVLRDDARVERQLRDAVRDQVEVGGLLHVLREQLEEAGVVDRVIVVVAGVHVERVLGDGARRDVEHVGEPLADGGVERLVHVHDALPAREVRGAQARHAHAGGDRRGRVLALRLEEEQPAAVHVAACRRRRLPPTLRPSASTA